MPKANHQIKKICSFYVSEYHLVSMLLPYLKKRIEEKSEIVTMLEENLEIYMEKLLENINFKKELKEEIKIINWNKKNNIKYTDVEIELKKNINKNILIIVSGKKGYIDVVNNNINVWINKNSKKTVNITIINAYEVIQFNKNIMEILNMHDKILNTSGEKEIEDVFDGYKKIENKLNVVNE